MKVLFSFLLASLVSNVTCFVPKISSNAASVASSPTCLSALDMKDQVGTLPPLGYFDPLGLIKNGPYGSPDDNFEHYRAVEVKHGRIAMAAFLGVITQQLYRFEGFLSPSASLKFSDLPNGMAGLKATPLEGLVQMAVLVGVHEVVIKQREGRQPGDFGLGYFGVSLENGSARQKNKLNVEIQNGRLAMLGILGMMANEQITGSILPKL
mmetsp:Transcript_24696/g.49110  ORF Transcript_24696/g.49110 Transcript_24696/m.49110 type:complete len:209 (+) Transcript_24696:126-752(+)|eukprot:CAMPEP_0182459646 /NCGR_PEP_ID=MMETSP1319-20130603/4724_1 /TAXON_ID=172717 /ORGANISM="Bolidomonas pacifica, Strain RCC208" /LENGTH=208 /DNA_ID=CAMNT_0024658609 /DNA_START=114 /DNA_END=740 /DNA_ORIENTATION=+